MNFHWTMRRLHRWGLSRKKLRGGFLHSKLGDKIFERELWIPSRESLARAWLIGMPVTTIPLLPLQSVIACGIGFIFRANLPVCFILQYLSNPATAIVQVPACYFVGRLLLGEPIGMTIHQIETDPMNLISRGSVGAIYLGAVVLGPLLGLLGYGLTHLVWREKPRTPGRPAGGPKTQA